MFKLVISDDEGHTTVVPLLRDEITIGRNQGNAIRLTERNVSRKHARLVKRNGAYIIEDLGSYNGVTVNGERIDENSALEAGDWFGEMSTLSHLPRYATVRADTLVIAISQSGTTTDTNRTVVVTPSETLYANWSSPK